MQTCPHIEITAQEPYLNVMAVPSKTVFIHLLFLYCTICEQKALPNGGKYNEVMYLSRFSRTVEAFEGVRLFLEVYNYRELWNDLVGSIIEENSFELASCRNFCVIAFKTKLDLFYMY